MKSSLALLVFAVVLCATAKVSAYGGGGGGGGAGALGGGGGGGLTLPAPPCPKNYLFSCQPNLAPAPCSSSGAYGAGGGYGSAGAYSENYPTVVSAPYAAYPAAVPAYLPYHNFYGNGI
ncbi:vitelline membrane protein Vm26Aa-like [Musca domestica]|uniref:Vitelline membrane protein Vm26Aa-like n=1 Tax=Musca domestica TaxID=7370 RepID=A0A9J7D225_MUSDO|nr:vitelline membrane protein Vm26Aa-like [Musca domestica]